MGRSLPRGLAIQGSQSKLGIRVNCACLLFALTFTSSRTEKRGCLYRQAFARVMATGLPVALSPSTPPLAPVDDIVVPRQGHLVHATVGGG